MEWIRQFQLFLFDFDGLLVNTEHLHFAAYIKMCRERGYDLQWDFNQFCLAAHFSATGLQESIYAAFPRLKEEEPDWSVLYSEKQKNYLDSLTSDHLELMPGVEPLLLALQEANLKRCVVTHSRKEQIDRIKALLPPLQSIPLWITRENYSKPKPDPESYLKAIELLSSPGDRIIGFEDSFRGLTALKGSGSKAVLICSKEHPQMSEVGSEISHFESFVLIDLF
jgi:beta-phosphoglucomutase